jgi:alkanesulfonate monooxygenase SsuD/methylene tetrahydromethanopterin reductase-like flavin-dependent oxidoreductase (luciferase family)
MTARMAAAVDDLSGGRLVLGLGAGWQEREHANYGWDLLDIDSRFARFAEGLQVITQLLQSDTPVDYAGSFYRLKEGILLPRPARPGGPPILIGGNGQHRTLPLVARYADEWNAVYILPDEFKRLSAELDGLLEQYNRSAAQVRRSLMTGCVFGRDRAEVERKVEARTQGKRSADDLRSHGVIVGPPVEFLEQLAALEAAGVQRVMLQWLDLDDLAGLEAMAAEIYG